MKSRPVTGEESSSYRDRIEFAKQRSKPSRSSTSSVRISLAVKVRDTDNPVARSVRKKKRETSSGLPSGHSWNCWPFSCVRVLGLQGGLPRTSCCISSLRLHPPTWGEVVGRRSSGWQDWIVCHWASARHGNENGQRKGVRSASGNLIDSLVSLLSSQNILRLSFSIHHSKSMSLTFFFVSAYLQEIMMIDELSSAIDCAGVRAKEIPQKERKGDPPPGQEVRPMAIPYSLFPGNGCCTKQPRPL